jgi:phosphohistidine swiveling domain-containing protein
MSTDASTGVIGRGELVSGGAFSGRVVVADEISEVLALLGEDLTDAVLLTSQPAATSVGPLLSRVCGVICTGGGPATHLAIVSRGLALACVMQADVGDLVGPGDRVAVDADGVVRRA